MGILDKLLGRDDEPQRPTRPRAAGVGSGTTDEQAIARYRYMLQTAPPETIEQAHAEAFAKLTPEQRRMLLQDLATEMPEAERRAAAGGLGDDPRSLARLATRAEVRRPGTLERRFGGLRGRGMGFGGMMAGSFLASMAGVVLGSAVAQSFLADAGVDADAADGTAGEGFTGDEQVADAADDGSAGFDGGDDFGGGGDFGEI